jgi:dTMP kinase
VPRGKLIVFEGIDGCGKTTQLQHLYQWLADRGSGQCPVLMTKEPGATQWGQSIRSLLLNPPFREPLDPYAELLLYEADRAQHVQTVLKPQLEAGAIILCDRHTDSTLAYQGYGRGLDLDTITYLNQIATQGLTSDLTLWLDVAVPVSRRRLVARGQADRMEQTDEQTDGQFYDRVRQGFAQLSQQYPQRIVRVEADAAEEEVAATIQGIVQERLGL